MLIEFIATSMHDAIAIEEAGADRIELVSALVEGGLTPSIGLIVGVVNFVKIPVNVIIRPHSAGFVYSNYDMDIIEQDLCAIVETNANGVVFGSLDSNGAINIRQLERLLTKVKDKAITFHRAIDETSDIIESARILSKYDEVKTILTSGGKGDFPSRMATIKRMKDVAPELEIMVGGGVSFHNLTDINMLTATGAYHVGTGIRTNQSAILGVDPEKAREFVKFARAL